MYFLYFIVDIIQRCCIRWYDNLYIWRSRRSTRIYQSTSSNNWRNSSSST